MTVVERTTEVPVPAGAVWDRVTSVEGIQHELRPWLRMTVPRGAQGISLGDVGVIPFDYDDITLVERGPGLRFLERSPMGSMRLWQHERVVEPRGDDACAVTDRLTFEPRVPGARRLVRRIIERIFAHRHRRLHGWFAAS